MNRRAEARDRYCFEGWELLPAQRVLLIKGVPEDLHAKPFDVLLALVLRAGQPVTRRTLLDEVWPNRIVEPGNIDVHVTRLRRLLGSAAIATIPGVGYQLAAVPLDAPTRVSDVPESSQRSSIPNVLRRNPTNIPVELPRIFGRADDLTTVTAKLTEGRMVTLLGPGGVGKTLLAQHLAAKLQSEFPDGCWLIELASLRGDSEVAEAIAQVLGIPLPSNRLPLVTISEALVGRRLLLLLDNCEHVVSGVAECASTLLSRVAGLRIVATSQALVRISGEAVVTLGGLMVPASDSLAAAWAAPAIDLFTQQVRKVTGEFAVTSENVAAVIEICRRLDGMALAIELAAARVPLLGVDEVRRRLDKRLKVLTHGHRDSPDRHQTLAATLAWSHGLLNRHEAMAFRRAAVFEGSFSLAMIGSVLGEPGEDENVVLDLVGSLVDKSLIVVMPGLPPRYRLLESPRAYGLEQLDASGEAETIRRRHAEAVLRWFEDGLASYWAQPGPQRLRHHLPDLENVRAALVWSAGSAHDLYVAITGASAWAWGEADYRQQGLAHCEQALSYVGPNTPAEHEARLCLWYANLGHFRRGPTYLAAAERAVRRYRESGHRAGLYQALGRQAILLALEGRAAEGHRMIDEMVKLYDASWPPLARSELLVARDFVANSEGDQEAAEALALEQLILAVRCGDTGKERFALVALEQCAAARGDFADAVRRGQELLAKLDPNSFDPLRHIYVGNLATALLMDGRRAEGEALAKEMVLLSARAGMLWARLDALALLCAQRGEFACSARLLGRARAANRDPEPVELAVRGEVERILSTALPAKQRKAAMAAGATMDDQTAALLAFPDDQGFLRQASAV